LLGARSVIIAERNSEWPSEASQTLTAGDSGGDERTSVFARMKRGALTKTTDQVLID
jgi:hypothetical protein